MFNNFKSCITSKELRIPPPAGHLSTHIKRPGVDQTVPNFSPRQLEETNSITEDYCEHVDPSNKYLKFHDIGKWSISI